MFNDTKTFFMPDAWVNREIDITVIGAGGTGSALLTELFQMDQLLRSLSNNAVHLNVTVWDGDTVSPANVGRQAFWSTDIGLNKAQVLVERFNQFGGIDWQYRDENAEAKSVLNYSKGLVITCVDSAAFRNKLAHEGRRRSYYTDNRLWLDMGNDTHQGQIVLGHFNEHVDGLHLPNVADLYPSLAVAVDDKSQSCSSEQALAKQDYGINKAVALNATTLLWQLIRHGSVDRHGGLVDVKQGSAHPIPISESYWAMMGYVSEKTAP